MEPLPPVPGVQCALAARAQANGAGDEPEVRAALLRPLLLGAALGVAVWALQWPLVAGYFALMDASEAVAATGTAYFGARVWGAPAALALSKTKDLVVKAATGKVQMPSRSPKAGTPLRCCSTPGCCCPGPTCAPPKRPCAAGSTRPRWSARALR